jgi:hypothetical protein
LLDAGIRLCYYVYKEENDSCPEGGGNMPKKEFES